MTTIGLKAFDSCSARLFTKTDGITDVDDWVIEAERETIVSANIKSGTRGIASDAFYNCEKLTDAEIPDGVISIGNDAFYGCISLKSVKPIRASATV